MTAAALKRSTHDRFEIVDAHDVQLTGRDDCDPSEIDLVSDGINGRHVRVVGLLGKTARVLEVRATGHRHSSSEQTSLFNRRQTCLSIATLWSFDTKDKTGLKKTTEDARQRILDTAYRLFSARGIRAVGTNEIIERAGVAKATLYSHFPSKNDLVLAFLEQREERWTHAFVVAEARRRGTTPAEQLLAIFDVFDEWFERKDFEGCSFVNVLIEMGADHPAGAASVRHLETIRGFLRTMAEEAGIEDPAEFALAWHVLMKGAIVQASQGIIGAGARAKDIAQLVLDQHTPTKRTKLSRRNPGSQPPRGRR